MALLQLCAENVMESSFTHSDVDRVIHLSDEGSSAPSAWVICDDENCESSVPTNS